MSVHLWSRFWERVVTREPYHDYSQAPKITAFVVAVANAHPSLDLAENFRGGVGQRETGRVKAALGPPGPQTGEPEVDHLQLGVVGGFGEDDILKKKFLLKMVQLIYGSFTLAKFVGKTISDSSTNCTCLGHLGWCDTNRNDPICVAPSKVAKASTVVLLSPKILPINFANVNKALL